MNEPTTTVTGNLTAEAETRFLASGVQVTTFTVASTPRVKDGQEYRDGETWFLRCTAWRKTAELAAELGKGQRVIVLGRLGARSWEKDGQKRTSVELTVDEFGVCPSLRSKPAPSADPWGGVAGATDVPF